MSFKRPALTNIHARSNVTDGGQQMDAIASVQITRPFVRNQGPRIMHVSLVEIT